MTNSMRSSIIIYENWRITLCCGIKYDIKSEHQMWIIKIYIWRAAMRWNGRPSLLIKRRYVRLAMLIPHHTINPPHLFYNLSCMNAGLFLVPFFFQFRTLHFKPNPDLSLKNIWLHWQSHLISMFITRFTPNEMAVIGIQLYSYSFV